MRMLKKIVIRLSILSALAAPMVSTTASASLACHSGGRIATSADGHTHVDAGPYGCQSYPTAEITVSGPHGSYTFEPSNGFPVESTVLSVSNTGRTIIAMLGDNLRANEASIMVYRDGYYLGGYTVTELLGVDHPSVQESLSVRVKAEGTDLVIRNLRGEELRRTHLRSLAWRGR